MSAIFAASWLDFRDDRTALEFPHIDPRLRGVLLSLAMESQGRGWHKPLVTSLYRTEAEERAAGAKSRTHKDCRAADLSLRPYVDGGVAPDDVVRWVNEAFGTLPQVTALRHDVGGGDHIHIQVVPRLLARSKWLRPPSMRG